MADTVASTAAATLRRQLVGLALALIGLSGLLLVLTLAQQRMQALATGQHLNASLAQVVEAQAASAVQAVDQRLQLTAQALALLEAGGRADAGAVGQLLREQTAALPFVRAIWLLDAQGRVLHAPEASAVGLQLADREFFQAYLRAPHTGFHLGTPVRSRATGQWLISAARPLRSPSGAFAGVLVAGLDPPYFDRLWNALDLGPDGVVALLRRDGTLLMRSPIVDAAMGQRLAAPGLLRLSASAAAGGEVRGPSPVDGRERLTAYRYLAAKPELLVLVARSTDSVLAAWRQQAQLAGLIWAVAAALVGLLFTALNHAWQQRLQADAMARQLAERLTLATDAAAIGVWDWNLQDKHWQASPTWYAMLGHSAETGPRDRHRLLDTVHTDDRARVAEQIQAVLNGADAPYGYEARMQHADGTLRWVQVAGRVVARDAAGKPIRLLGTRIDVTERQQLLQALQDGEARFRALFEQAAVGVAHVSLDGAFTLVNQRFADITGRSRAGLQACSFQQITHPDDVDADLDQVRRLLAGEIGTYAMEKRYLRPDGGQVWVQLTVSLVHDSAGAPLHFVSVVQDIDARKQAERAQAAQLAELQRWQAAMMDRELRIVEIKRELNAALASAGQPARYPSVEPSPEPPP